MGLAGGLQPPAPYKTHHTFIHREYMDMSFDPAVLSPLFELSPDAVIGAENGVICFANPAAVSLLDAETGAPAERCLPPEIVRDPSGRFVASGVFGEQNLAFSVVRSDGGHFSLYHITRLRDTLPSPVTETAAAELGSLLMTQRLALDMLVEATGAEESPRTAGYTAILYRTYYRVKRLRDHFAALSLGDGEALRARRRSLALNELFSEVCSSTDILAREKGISVRFEAKERCVILGDAQLLEMLLFNLLANSLLHSEAGGVIRVSLTRQVQKYVLAVDDPGSGIAPERLVSLLSGETEPDFTDPGAGTGLGLSLVRSIAERHGGALFIESRPGKGTHMRVTFQRPGPEELTNLREPDAYVPDSMDMALTELSVVLDKSVYTRKMFD